MHRGVLPLRTKSGLPSRPQGVPTHPRVLSMSSLTRPARTASIVLRRPSRHPGRNRLSFPGPRLCRLPSLQPMGSLTAKPFPSPGPKLSMFLGLSRLLCPMLFRSLRTNRPLVRRPRPTPSRTLLHSPNPSRNRSRTLLRSPHRSRMSLRSPHLRRLKSPCQSPSRHLNRSPSRRPSQS